MRAQKLYIRQSFTLHIISLTRRVLPQLPAGYLLFTGIHTCQHVHKFILAMFTELDIVSICDYSCLLDIVSLAAFHLCGELRRPRKSYMCALCVSYEYSIYCDVYMCVCVPCLSV